MVLAAARLVCDLELPHVWAQLSDFLDHSGLWTIEQAAANGFKFLVQHLALERAGAKDEHEDDSLVMDFAASNGHLDILVWLHSTDRLNGCSTRAMDDAAKNGHLKIVQWLHANRSEGCTTKAMNYASMHGHLPVVEWLHANRSEGCTTRAMNLAAQNGHLHVMQWLDAHRSEGCTSAALNYACAEGHLAVVKWLCEHRKDEATPTAMINAARNGHVYILEYLGMQFPACLETVGTKMVRAAVVSGHLHVLTWLIETLPMKALKCDEDNGSWMDVAAQYGQVDILQWFHDHATILPMGVNGTLPVCSVEAIEKAAGNGHHMILTFLYEHQLVQITDSDDAVKALVAAVVGGHLDCVEWLVFHFEELLAQSPSAGTTVMDQAAAFGCMNILQFLHDYSSNTASGAWATSFKAVNEAARQGFLDVFEWLHAHPPATVDEDGSPVDGRWSPIALELATSSGHLKMVQWLTEYYHDACMTLEAMNVAAYMDHLEIARFLYTHHRSFCSIPQALEHAHEGGADEMMLWLETLQPEGVTATAY